MKRGTVVSKASEQQHRMALVQEEDSTSGRAFCQRWSFDIQGNRALKRRSDLNKMTQQVRGRAETRDQILGLLVRTLSPPPVSTLIT